MLHGQDRVTAVDGEGVDGFCGAPRGPIAPDCLIIMWPRKDQAGTH